MLQHQNDRGEKQKQQELLRPLGEMCQIVFHASSVEPMEHKWKCRLSGLITLLPSPGFQVPTNQPYCVQPDTKWKEHSTHLQRAGARLHIGSTPVVIKISAPPLCSYFLILTKTSMDGYTGFTKTLAFTGNCNCKEGEGENTRTTGMTAGCATNYQRSKGLST